MPKRSYSAYQSTNRAARRAPTSKYRKRATYAPMGRVGYTSVARTRGAPVRGEMKYFDTENQGTAIAATSTTWVAGTIVDPTTTINLGSAAVATPLCLFAPIVGAALNQGIGRAVKMMKCKVRGAVVIPRQAAQAAADNGIEVRMLLVLDKQTNSAQMTGAQLMRDAGNAYTTLNSYQNPDNFGRFQVLKDKRIAISNPNLSGSPTTADMVQQGIIRPFKFSYRFKKPLEVRFNATNGGTVADIVDHSLHFLIAVPDVTLGPLVYYYTRVGFKE